MGIPAGLLPQTVTKIRPTTSTDTYGNTVYTYGSGTSITAWLQQDDRKEPLSDGRAALEQIWLLITNEPDVLGHDRIVFGTTTFEVDGPPEPVYTPAGFHHLEATLRVVAG
jgi:hypothetical protein